MSRNKRIQIYRTETKLDNRVYNHNQLYPVFPGKNRLTPAAVSDRKRLFDAFEKMYVPKHNALSAERKRDIREGFADPVPNGLDRNSKRFSYLISFGNTDYGSSVIKEMV